MFLFSCLTGLSYTDVYHLTEQHIFHEAGMTWIRKPRMKTGNVCHIPLLSEATAIIERYRGIHTRAFRYSENADLSHGTAYLRIANDIVGRRIHRERFQNARTQPNQNHASVCGDFSRACLSGRGANTSATRILSTDQLKPQNNEKYIFHTILHGQKQDQ